jgi:hypothetical protein
MSLVQRPVESLSSSIFSGFSEWQLSFRGRALDMGTAYACTDNQTELLLVTGFGESYIEQIAADLGERGLKLAVCSLKYPTEVQLTPDVIEATIYAGLSAVIRSINLNASRPVSTPIDLAGRSKGFAEVAQFASKHQNLCNSVTGSAPFGINRGLDRFEIKRRLKASGLMSSVFQHPDAKRLASELTAGSAYIQSQDSIKILKSLHKSGILKKIVVGKDDPVCPPAECKELLQLEQIIEITEGGHNPLSSSIGIEQVMLAVEPVI